VKELAIPAGIEPATAP